MKYLIFLLLAGCGTLIPAYELSINAFPPGVSISVAQHVFGATPTPSPSPVK